MIRLLPLPLLVLAACAVDGRKPAGGDPAPDDTAADGDTADTAETDCDVVWYRDADGDGYGAGEPVDCDWAEGYAGDDGDCDDADPHVFPGAPEACDGKDNACAGGWSETQEAGLVTQWTAEGPVSHAETWAAGTDDAPVAAAIEGDWSVCAGTFYVALTITGDTRIEGAGRATTVLSGGDVGRVVDAQAPIEIVGLTLRDGEVDGDGGIVAIRDADARFESVELSGGMAARGGALAGTWTAEATVTLVDVLVTGNLAEGPGGGFYLEGPVDLTIEDSAFRTNAALEGGAIRATGAGALDLELATFELDSSLGAGGAVLWEGTGDARLVDVTAASNAAEGDGAGLHVTAADITVEGGTFQENTSLGAGGGLRLQWTGAASVTGATFSTNEAFLGAGIAGYGEAGGALTVADVTMSGGTAYSGGGAYFLDSAVLIEGGLLSGNTAEEGAALTVEGCPSVEIGPGTRIEDNTAAFRGGGLLALGSTVTVTGDLSALDGFRRNEAEFGGAICYELDADDTLAAVDADFGVDADDNYARLDGPDLYTPGRQERVGDGESFVCGYDADCE